MARGGGGRGRSGAQPERPAARWDRPGGVPEGPVQSAGQGARVRAQGSRHRLRGRHAAGRPRFKCRWRPCFAGAAPAAVKARDVGSALCVVPWNWGPPSLLLFCTPPPPNPLLSAEACSARQCPVNSEMACQPQVFLGEGVYKHKQGLLWSLHPSAHACRRSGGAALSSPPPRHASW